MGDAPAVDQLMDFAREGALASNSDKMSSKAANVQDDADSSTKSVTLVKDFIVILNSDCDLSCLGLLGYDVVLTVCASDVRSTGWLKRVSDACIHQKRWLMLSTITASSKWMLSTPLLTQEDVDQRNIELVDHVMMKRSETALFNMLMSDLPNSALRPTRQQQQRVLPTVVLHMAARRDTVMSHVNEGEEILKQVTKDDSGALVLPEDVVEHGGRWVDLALVCGYWRCFLLPGELKSFDLEEELNASSMVLKTARKFTYNICQSNDPSRWVPALISARRFLAENLLPSHRPVVAENVGFLDSARRAVFRCSMKGKHARECTVEALNWIRTGDLGTMDVPFWEYCVQEALKSPHAQVRDAALAVEETLGAWKRVFGKEEMVAEEDEEPVAVIREWKAVMTIETIDVKRTISPPATTPLPLKSSKPPSTNLPARRSGGRVGMFIAWLLAFCSFAFLGVRHYKRVHQYLQQLWQQRQK